MIYVGFIHFNGSTDKNDKLSSVLESYTHTSPVVIRKNSLTLCYGKLSDKQDKDEIWENSSSILMGRIFPKEQEHSFTQRDFKSLSNLNKEEILKKIWGKYIYINVAKSSPFVEVVIDSTGQLPFFYYVFPDGNVLFSSDIEIISKILGKKLEYHWNYLCSYLAYGNSSTTQTPFKDVYELPPACCLTITKTKKQTEPFWDPLNSYKPPAIQEDDAVDILQKTLKPWVEPYKNICVSLSGGLDSSSLVYCLKDIKREDQKLNAFNYFHGSIQSSNEIFYARKVCQEADIDLIEIDTSHTLPFDPYPKKQFLNPNKPFPGLVSLKSLESISNHIPSDNACILSGHGSDHIFMRPPTKKSMADYLLENGLKGITKPLKNITDFYRDSFFTVIKENITCLNSYLFAKRLGKRHPKNVQKSIPVWIKPAVLENTLPNFMHPIYEYLPTRLLPGKYAQIDFLYEGLASIHVEMNPTNPNYYPYLYQPVVEFALNFSTYKLFDKGYDRYPLRESVSQRFKTETVWRRDKSQTTGMFQLGIKKNLDYILHLCLEGQFSKKNFIDKESLHKSITLASNGDINYLWPLMQLVSIEIFIKYWEESICG